MVAVGLSAEMERYYGIYPSIEFDIVAVTAGEAEEIKNGGVDKYFAPDSALRKRLDPLTVYFSQERTEPETLAFSSARWDRWLKKKPETLTLIADLPPSPGASGEDPRVIYIDLKKNGVFARPVYVEIEPEKISRVFEVPKDPRTGAALKIRRPIKPEPALRVHRPPVPAGE
jgi:hypothetical protein